MQTLNKKKNLKINIFLNISYQLIIVLVPFFTSPYLSRTLGAEVTGIYSYTYSIAYYAILFGILGFTHYGNRCIARCRDDAEKLRKTFWTLYYLQLISFSISISVYCVALLIVSPANIIIFWIQLVAIIGNMIDVTWFYYGNESFGVVFVRNLFIKIINLVLIFVLVKGPGDLWIYTLIMGGATFVGQLVTWPYILKNIRPCKVCFDELKQHIKPVLILFIPTLATSIFTVMDKIMLGIISPYTEVGYYDYSEKIIAIPKALITALGTAMLPRVSNLVSRNDDVQAKKYLKITMYYVFAFSSALLFGIAAVSSIFAVIYWGKDYHVCGLLITILAPSVFFALIGNVLRTQYLIPYMKDKQYVAAIIIGAVVNFVGNIFLIRYYGAVGACISTVLAEFSITFVHILSARKDLPLLNYFINGFSFILFGAIMFIIIYLIKDNFKVDISSLLILILIGASIYIILCIFYILFSPDSVSKMIRERFKKNVKKV